MKPCGTYAGYQTHKRRNEEACADCKRANSEYSQQYRGSKPRAEHFRLYPTDEELRLSQQRRLARSSARNRALRRLGREYPDRLAELVAEEAAKDGLAINAPGKVPTRG